MSQTLLSSDPPEIEFLPSSMDIDEPGPSAPPTLKRAASTSFEAGPEERRKRLRESADSDADSDDERAAPNEDASFTVVAADDSAAADTKEPAATTGPDEHADTAPADGDLTLEHELALELNCGCCTEICYNPVLVSPCQHTFCGSCFTLWIQNGGSNCPACRSVSTSVTPARPLQKIIEILVKHAPNRARTQREKEQADEIYKAGSNIRLPSPKQPSPEPNVSRSGSYARPCHHCPANNQFGWRCRHPIPDPVADPDNAISLDDGVPVGHAYCGNCDLLHAIEAPTSSRCDFCSASFCGIGVQGRCCAVNLAAQHPQGFADLSDLIQAPELYEIFENNSYEADILIEYLREKQITPQTIYSEMIEYYTKLPQGFAVMIASGVFNDMHGPGIANPDPSAPRRKACRDCAGEIFISSLMLWWILERKKAQLDEHVAARPNCGNGPHCEMQSNLEHAKEFNHIIALADPNTAAQPDVAVAADPPTVPAASSAATQPADRPEGAGGAGAHGVLLAAGSSSGPEGAVHQSTPEGNNEGRPVAHAQSSDNGQLLAQPLQVTI